MKSYHLCLYFLIATLFTLQVNSLKLAQNQAPLNIDIGDRNYFDRFGFKELLQVATHASDPSQTIANVFRYYIDGRQYFNYVQGIFADADTDHRKLISLKQFYQITDEQGVHRADAHRVSELVRGLPEGSHDDGEDVAFDSYTFNQAADVLFAESVSIVTFSYVVQSSKHSRSVVVTVEEVENALVKVFDTFGDLFPAPNCEEIKYLFNQCDTDQDRRLNLQEFHIFLSIYLRYYKAGIQSNRFAVIIMKDVVFEYVWKNEDGLGSRTDKINFLKVAFARFLQMSIYDKTQNQMSHLFFTKFDADGSGDIDKQEFGRLLSFFQAPENEVDVLFVAADTDGSGRVDFAEFVVTMTTLLRKLTADFGFNLVTLTSGDINADNAYSAFKEALDFLGLDLLSEDTFKETFTSVDVDHTGTLDSDEYAGFLSQIIGQLRSKIRVEEEAQITAVASIDVNKVSPEDVQAAKEEAAEQVSDIVHEDSESPGKTEIITQVQQDTGVTIDELNEAVHSQIDGASVEDVIQAAESIATEQVIEAVTAAVIDNAGGDECATSETIEDAIKEVIKDGSVDDIVKDIQESSTTSIVDVVSQVVEDTHTEQEREAEKAEEEREEERESQEAQGVSTEQTQEVVNQIQQETGYSAEEVDEVLSNHVEGASVEEVMQAAHTIATEEVINAVATAVLEEGDECLTPQQLEATIEKVVEGGAVDQIISEEVAESASQESLVDVVSEQVEEQREASESSDNEESESSDHEQSESSDHEEPEASESSDHEQHEESESSDHEEPEASEASDHEEPEASEASETSDEEHEAAGNEQPEESESSDDEQKEDSESSEGSDSDEGSHGGDSAFIQFSGFNNFLPTKI